MSTAVSKWEQPSLPAPPVSRDIVDGWARQIAEVAKLATYIAATDFVPKGYRGQDAAVAAAILAGREMGIGPMTSLQHLYVVDGRPAMSAQLMRALVFAHGHRIRVDESTSARCVLSGQRAGASDWSAPVVWSADEVRRAGLAGKTNWQHYPRQMLLARATAEICRRDFPDVIGGMAYVVEEVEDLGPDEEPAAPVKSTRTVSRARAPQAAPPPLPIAHAAVGPEEPARPHAPSARGGQAPPLPERRIVGDIARRSPSPARAPRSPANDEEAPEEPHDDNDAHKPLSEPQRAQLFRLLGQLGRITPRTERIRTVAALIGRPLDSMSQLTRHEATALIDVLVRATEAPEILAPLVEEGWARLGPHIVNDDDTDDHDQPPLWDPPEEET